MSEGKYQKEIAEISKTIYSYCLSKTSTPEDAEDLSQDILLELTRSVKNIRDENAFYAFMWGVAGNVYKQWYRKKLKNTTYELPENIPSEDQLFSEEDSKYLYLLRRELTLLSAKYRKATISYYIENHSCAEIANLLSISESMVKYLLFKSRKILKEGMNMERNLGELSHNPKTLIPMYSGQGPNQFGEFMQNKIRQNIVSACYNDTLTAQQISLETGIPLPYLDDEIKELESKKIIIRDGAHYKANIIVIASECADETECAVTKYHEKIADKMEAFIENKISEYKNIRFIGSDFSESTLRWQLCTVLFRMISGIDCGKTDAPQTGWGESAYMWCVEKLSEKHIFSYCGVDSKHEDSLYFFDYLKGGKGNHHDFYGNDRYINIFCDICSGREGCFGEYDLEAIAEMMKKGYVIKENGSFKATVPVYTAEQYKQICSIAEEFINTELIGIIHDMDKTAARILSAHTPKHLQSQVAGIAGMDKFVNAVCIPAAILIERNFLSTSWHPLEMPTTYVVLKN